MKGRKLTVIKGGLVQENPWSRRWRRVKRLSFGLGLTVLALLLVGSAGSLVVRALVGQEIIRITTLDSQVPFQGLLLKHEQKVMAPAPGNFSPSVESGSRVRVGQQLGTLETSSGTIPIICEAAGVFITGLDGLELDFPRRDQIDLELLAAAQFVMGNPPTAQAVTIVDGDKPLGVIVTNSYIQLLGRLAQRPQGNSHLLLFQEGEFQHQSQVQGVMEYGGQTWILWNITNLPDALSLNRLVSGAVHTSRDEAARLPAGALVWQGNRPGVLIQARNQRIFQEVEILHQTPQEVWLGGLKEGQRVLIFPWGTGILKWWWLR